MQRQKLYHAANSKRMAHSLGLAAVIAAAPALAQAPGGPAGRGGGPGGGQHPIDTHGVTRVYRDVAYANLSPKEKMDIYLPNQGTAPYPVIFAVHGGGFAGGDKNSGEVNPEMDGLTRGFAVVSVNYRLARESPEQHLANGGPNAPPLANPSDPGSPFPDGEKDLKAAVRFLRANAKTYQLDPNRIVAWGDSAGGNLVSLLGTSAGNAGLEDLSMGNADQSSNVQLVVDFYGPTNFLTMDSLYANSGVKPAMQHSAPHSSESDYMGAPLTSIPDKVKLADPTTYISAKSPPFFVENGSQDQIVPPRQDVDFAAALAKAIGPDNVEHVVIPGARHGGPQFGTSENLDKVFAFIASHLK